MPDNFTFLEHFAEHLTMDELLQLQSHAVPRPLKSGDIFVDLYSTDRRLAYIERGIIRTYAFKHNGDEATLMLRWEGQFVGSHDAIILKQPSKFIYQAMEDTDILEIDYEIVEKIMIENPKFEPLRYNIILSMLAASLQMMEDFVLLTPEARYRKLVAERLDIVNRVPDKYLAPMLGVTPVTLSRIRKRIIASG